MNHRPLQLRVRSLNQAFRLLLKAANQHHLRLTPSSSQLMQFSCEARLNGIGTVARITIMIPVLIDDALNGAGAASAVLWVGVTGEPWPGRFSHTFTVDITGRSVYDASFNSGDAVKFSSFLDKTLRGIADDRARQLEELRDELCVAETAAAS